MKLKCKYPRLMNTVGSRTSVAKWGRSLSESHLILQPSPATVVKRIALSLRWIWLSPFDFCLREASWESPKLRMTLEQETVRSTGQLPNLSKFWSGDYKNFGMVLSAGTGFVSCSFFSTVASLNGRWISQRSRENRMWKPEPIQRKEKELKVL